MMSPSPSVPGAEYPVPWVGSVQDSLVSLRTTITSWLWAFSVQSRSMAVVGAEAFAAAVWPNGSLIALTMK